jgi:hypothetical protein
MKKVSTIPTMIEKCYIPMVLEQKIVGKVPYTTRQSLQATILDSTIKNSKHKITNSYTNALELLFKAKYEKIFSDWGDQICVFMRIKYPFEKYYIGL